MEQTKTITRLKKLDVKSSSFEGASRTTKKSSPSSDLSGRRGVFSRRHFGSVELLISADPENNGRFRVETGERETIDELSSPIQSPLHLENPEIETRWYFKYFLGKMHQNYVGITGDKLEPFILSVVLTDVNNLSALQYRAILWTKMGNDKICMPYNPAKPLTAKSFLSQFNLEKFEKGPKEIFDPEIQKDLLILEEQEGAVNYKFGVLYAKEGQMTDDEFYGNEEASEAFDRFFSMLGERVQLKGWDGYRGGLDVKSDSTGTESVYTMFEGHEIMFHVSTLLPYSKENKQQVERKRHIGNDIANVVFFEYDGDKTPVFSPSMMKTHFTHIYVVVYYNTTTLTYKLAVFSAESLPLFSPPVPRTSFVDQRDFRDFILVKLINGEKAAFKSPVFAQKRHRTLDMLVKNIYQEYTSDSSKSTMMTRRAISDLIPENITGSRRKEEARQHEFVKVGQSLKLKTIVRGDAPTSMVTSSGVTDRTQPWEPQTFVNDFKGDIVCGDSWGDKVVAATSAGTFVLEENVQPRLIFDKTVLVKQLNIVEAHGLMVMRVQKGRDCCVYAFRLSDFENDQNEDQNVIKTKADIKKNKLECSRGCHTYCLSRLGGSHVHLTMAVGRKLIMLRWKHSAWSALLPQPLDTDTNIIDEFEVTNEIQSPDTPLFLTPVEDLHDGYVCVGYKNQFDLVNDKSGDVTHFYTVPVSKPNLISAVDIFEEDEPELVLSYNHISHFKRLSEESRNEFEISWNAEPKNIVCAFPYIIAFTGDMIEIRLLINGNLVHSMAMPHLQLITAKCDIYFASSAGGTHSPLPRDQDRFSFSPPPSPSALTSPGLNIYKIPYTGLVGELGIERSSAVGILPIISSPHSLIGGGGRSQSASESNSRSLALRSKLPHLQHTESRRSDSASSSADSGIYSGGRISDTATPPVSPFLTCSIDEEEAVIE